MRHVIDKDGRVFISIDAMLAMLSQIIETRDELVASDPKNQIYVPGSDAACHIIKETLGGIRNDYVNRMDLSDTAADTLEELYGFLDEQ